MTGGLWIVDTSVVVSGIITSDAESPVAVILNRRVRAEIRFALCVELPAEYRHVLLHAHCLEVREEGLEIPAGRGEPGSAAYRRAVIQAYGLHDVLTVASMEQDLQAWQYAPYLELIGQRQVWTNELISRLLHAQPLAR